MIPVPPANPGDNSCQGATSDPPMNSGGETGGNGMGGTGPVRQTIQVVNPLGLHYRPAQVFSETAKRFTSNVTVWHGTNRADGRSLVQLILLVALPGSELVLEIDGPDANEAMGVLAQILSSPID